VVNAAGRFIAPASIVLDANGEGTAVVTVPAGMQWEADFLSVSTTTATGVGVPQSVATVFYGNSPEPLAFAEETFFGNGDSSDTRYSLYGGESLCVHWTGGVAGATATMTLRGKQYQVT
jgi:hypothetical protein